MKQLLVVAHAPSPNTRALVASIENAIKPIEALQSTVLSPFETNTDHIMACDGILLFTTENFGYMSGALKDMFDRTYYQVIDFKRGLPYVLIVRAGNDGTGATRSTESITQGLGWSKAQEALILKGEYTPDFLAPVSETATGFGTALAEGII